MKGLNFIDGIKFIDPEYIDKITVKRRGEPRLGEVLSIITSEEELNNSTARYLLIGIPEDIGIRANGGRPGAAKTWEAFLTHFCSLPLAKNNPLDHVALLGTIDCHDLMEQSKGLDWQNLGDQKTYNALITALDHRVVKVVQPLISAGFIPVVIGGGHNNALGLLKSTSQALRQAVNCLNIDAHTDLRGDDYRHSGNGFQRAFLENNLAKYRIFGLHEHTLSEGITQFILQINQDTKRNQNDKHPQPSDNHQDNNQPSDDDTTEDKIIDYLSLNQWIDTPVALRQDKLAQWLKPICEDHFCLEIDLDVIADMGSSAQSPIGLSIEEVRTLARSIGGHKHLRYIHLCEGAPELGLYPSQVVKTLSALCLDLMQ